MLATRCSADRCWRPAAWTGAAVLAIAFLVLTLTALAAPRALAQPVGTGTPPPRGATPVPTAAGSAAIMNIMHAVLDGTATPSAFATPTATAAGLPASVATPVIGTAASGTPGITVTTAPITTLIQQHFPNLVFGGTTFTVTAFGTVSSAVTVLIAPSQQELTLAQGNLGSIEVVSVNTGTQIPCTVRGTFLQCSPPSTGQYALVIGSQTATPAAAFPTAQASVPTAVSVTPLTVTPVVPFPTSVGVTPVVPFPTSVTVTPVVPFPTSVTGTSPTVTITPSVPFPTVTTTSPIVTTAPIAATTPIVGATPIPVLPVTGNGGLLSQPPHSSGTGAPWPAGLVLLAAAAGLLLSGVRRRHGPV